MNNYIISDPHIMSGTPVIKGTRVPVEVLLYRLKEGNSEVVAKLRGRFFDIKKEQ